MKKLILILAVILLIGVSCDYTSRISDTRTDQTSVKMVCPKCQYVSTSSSGSFSCPKCGTWMIMI